MKIIFAYRGRYLVRQALELETLAALLRQEGYQVRLVYDPGVFSAGDNVFQAGALSRRMSSARRFAEKVLEHRPDAVVMSVLPAGFAFFREVMERLKAHSPDLPLICLGFFPTLSPGVVMERSLCDYAICGEAEGPLTGLLESLSRVGMPRPEAGVWQRKDGEIVHRPIQGLTDLDRLPFPHKDLFSPYVSQRRSYAAMVSRGCPFSCSYCEETCVRAKVGPGYFRRRSVASVMEELGYGKRKYGFSEVIFKDSYLSGDAAWLVEFCRRYREEIAVPFKCFCTISGFSAETARLLKDAGCYCVEFGLQTTNDEIRRNLLHRKETGQDAAAAFAACAAAGLSYDVDHMFGLPGETEEDHREAALFYHGLRGLNRVKVHHLVFYPDAPILAMARERGELSEEDLAAVAAGAEDDFYADRFSSEENRALARAYGALFKILPLLSRAALERLLGGGRLRDLARIPAPAMAALQAAAALKGRDKRFFIYLFSYPRVLFYALRDALG